MTKSVAGTNENRFKQFFSKKYGENLLEGKCNYKSDDNNVSISVDNSICFGDKKILIEVDSGNMAKLLVGQYTLLNELCNEEKDIIFLVIHFYKDYNSNRTINNLSFINNSIYDNKGIKFKAFHFDQLKKFCEENDKIESFFEKLYT